MLTKVVFPAPFGPMMQRTSPLARVKLTFSFATKPRKRLVRRSVLSSAAMMLLPEDGFDQTRQTFSEQDDHCDEDQTLYQRPVILDRPDGGKSVGKGGNNDGACKGT